MFLTECYVSDITVDLSKSNRFRLNVSAYVLFKQLNTTNSPTFSRRPDSSCSDETINRVGSRECFECFIIIRSERKTLLGIRVGHYFLYRGRVDWTRGSVRVPTPFVPEFRRHPKNHLRVLFAP